MVYDTKVLLKESNSNELQKINVHTNLSRACFVFYKTRPIKIAREFIFIV